MENRYNLRWRLVVQKTHTTIYLNRAFLFILLFWLKQRMFCHVHFDVELLCNINHFMIHLTTNFGCLLLVQLIAFLNVLVHTQDRCVPKKFLRHQDLSDMHICPNVHLGVDANKLLNNAESDPTLTYLSAATIMNYTRGQFDHPLQYLHQISYDVLQRV